MSKNVNWAAIRIKLLADKANSEPVKLAALKAIISSMMDVSEFADLQDRIIQLEEQLNVLEGADNMGQAG